MRRLSRAFSWSLLRLAWLVTLALSQPAGAVVVPELHEGAGELRDLSFRDATPARDVYRSLGEAWNLYVAFDPDLPERELTLDLPGVTAEEAFTRATRAAGHLYQVVGERSVLIAEDTPAKRSRYENLMVRMFVIEHVSAGDVSQLFESLLQLEDVAAHDENRAVLVRGTAAQIETAATLVRALDQPRGEVELDVDLLLLEGSSRLPRRLGAGKLEELRATARILAEPALAVLDRETARWQLQEDLTVTVEAELTTIETGLTLSVRPKMHTNGEVTLEVATAWTDLDPILGKAALEKTVEMAAATLTGEWSTRLRPGETLLVSGILPGVERRGALAAALGAGAEGSKMVLALTPRVTRARVLPEEDFEIICAAAEGLTGLCGQVADEQP